ncbi:hypothetical protein M430DRAFT_24885 [Amorphotheca resinae ATCC 22711]|uniref:Uncharacterized protein n=1 Tax=Amorphotheca resinae ATCC 22711 TaxID=857342 RepID=A0A2T3B9S2_AMORE|nr:hypothetical protein M430DRAFT_24885 [Amorphotheca resinae ATCC 22711]PSS25024.1 hypothetical protein M430DRAFT_24885 [Amorphotheca resinae ATCC 22711]
MSQPQISRDKVSQVNYLGMETIGLGSLYAIRTLGRSKLVRCRPRDAPAATGVSKRAFGPRPKDAASARTDLASVRLVSPTPRQSPPTPAKFQLATRVTFCRRRDRIPLTGPGSFQVTGFPRSHPWSRKKTLERLALAWKSYAAQLVADERETFQ